MTKVTDIYDDILKKAKEFNYTTEKYELLEEIMVVARRANLPLHSLSKRKIKDQVEFVMSLTGATALYESYKALGDEGRIVYWNEKGQKVHHYCDGRIKVILDRA